MYCQVYIVVPFDKPIPQGSRFLENHTLHVCSCIEWIHVCTPHFHGSKGLTWCDPSVLLAFGLGVGEGECSMKREGPQLDHTHSFYQVIMTIRTWAAWHRNRSLTYTLPALYISVWTSILAIVCIYLRTARCQHWVSLILSFDHRLLTSASLVLSFSVDPSPLTPYPWCHLTRNDPVLFICWILFLFYDTGADWHNAKENILKNVSTQVMLILIAIPAWRVCEFISMLIRHRSFSDACFRSFGS